MNVSPNPDPNKSYLDKWVNSQNQICQCVGVLFLLEECFFFLIRNDSIADLFHTLYQTTFLHFVKQKLKV